MLPKRAICNPLCNFSLALPCQLVKDSPDGMAEDEPPNQGPSRNSLFDGQNTQAELDASKKGGLIMCFTTQDNIKASRIF